MKPTAFRLFGHATRVVGIASLLLVFALAITLFTANTASAHARYQSSVPAADSTVTQAPDKVTITFKEEVDPSKSDIVIYGATYNVVSVGHATVDPNDLTTMSIPMKGDDSETYVVVWHNVSADDGDPIAGAFTFNVGSEASTPTPTGDTSSGGGSSSSGVPGWVAALVGILGLVVGAGATWAVLRRSAEVR